MTGTVKTCLTCGGVTSGFKCELCGAEAANFETSHSCGSQHYVAKCVTCNQAETKCSCVTAKESVSAAPAPEVV